MIRHYLLILILFSIVFASKAQTAGEVYDDYLDFNLARFQGEKDKISDLGEKIIPNAAKLPDKARVNFYCSIAKVYEDENQAIKAIFYYEKVVEAEPKYYVAHRALGYLYLAKAKEIEASLNNSATNKDVKLNEDYLLTVNKALPHLEKAQACEPDENTLKEIKLLYKNIDDTERLKNLPDKLLFLSKDCIDILTD